MKIRIGEGELKLLGNGQIEELSFRDGSIFPKGQFSWLIRAFRDGKEVGIRLVDRGKGADSLSLGKNGRTSGHAGDRKRNIYGFYRSGVPGFF